MFYYTYEIPNNGTKIICAYLQDLMTPKSKKTKHPCKLSFVRDPSIEGHVGIVSSRVKLNLTKVPAKYKFTVLEDENFGRGKFKDAGDKHPKKPNDFNALFDGVA